MLKGYRFFIVLLAVSLGVEASARSFLVSTEALERVARLMAGRSEFARAVRDYRVRLEHFGDIMPLIAGAEAEGEVRRIARFDLMREMSRRVEETTGSALRLGLEGRTAQVPDAAELARWVVGASSFPSSPHRSHVETEWLGLAFAMIDDIEGHTRLSDDLIRLFDRSYWDERADLVRVLESLVAGLSSSGRHGRFADLAQASRRPGSAFFRSNWQRTHEFGRNAFNQLFRLGREVEEWAEALGISEEEARLIQNVLTRHFSRKIGLIDPAVVRGFFGMQEGIPRGREFERVVLMLGQVLGDNASLISALGPNPMEVSLSATGAPRVRRILVDRSAGRFGVKMNFPYAIDSGNHVIFEVSAAESVNPDQMQAVLEGVSVATAMDFETIGTRLTSPMDRFASMVSDAEVGWEISDIADGRVVYQFRVNDLHAGMPHEVGYWFQRFIDRLTRVESLILR